MNPLDRRSVVMASGQVWFWRVTLAPATGASPSSFVTTYITPATGFSEQRITTAPLTIAPPIWSLLGFSYTDFTTGGIRIRGVGIPLWILAVLMLIPPIVTRLIRPQRPGFCSKCGYCLTGNTSGVCPECGTPVPKEPAEKSSRPA